MPLILDLPDVRQSGPADCGAACLECVWRHFGTRNRPAPAHPLDGCAPDAIELLLWESGLSVQAGRMDVADLAYHTGRGRPVIACVTLAEDGSGHWIVARGVAWRTVHFHDPLTGPGKEPAADFLQRWTDRTRRAIEYQQWGIAVGR